MITLASSDPTNNFELIVWILAGVGASVVIASAVLWHFVTKIYKAQIKQLKDIINGLEDRIKKIEDKYEAQIKEKDEELRSLRHAKSALVAENSILEGKLNAVKAVVSKRDVVDSLVLLNIIDTDVGANDSVSGFLLAAYEKNAKKYD